MQELPSTGNKKIVSSLHYHFLQTLRICPPREGQYLPHLDSFPLSLDKEQEFCREGQMTVPEKLSLNQKYL